MRDTEAYARGHLDTMCTYITADRSKPCVYRTPPRSPFLEVCMSAPLKIVCQEPRAPGSERPREVSCTRLEPLFLAVEHRSTCRLSHLLQVHKDARDALVRRYALELGDDRQGRQQTDPLHVVDIVATRQRRKLDKTPPSPRPGEGTEPSAKLPYFPCVRNGRRSGQGCASAQNAAPNSNTWDKKKH